VSFSAAVEAEVVLVVEVVEAFVEAEEVAVAVGAESEEVVAVEAAVVFLVEEEVRLRELAPF
jgi:hypothetical protein